VRDEVLARLLALNAERHAEEVKLGLVSTDGKRLTASGDAEDDSTESDDGESKPTKKADKKKTKAKSKKKTMTGQLKFGGDD
jgi:hypothetical protein